MNARMTVGSLFSGVGGFDLALQREGFDVRWQVEIDDFAQKVLTRHWPDVAKFSDVRDCGAANLEPVDLIVGGFPCQDVSVAGQRAGLAGARSGLFFEAMRIVIELKPEWVVMENVAGLLSSHGGRDLSAVIQTFRECGYLDGGLRVLDSRFFGVAQRRRRVFLVGHRGDSGGRARAVLFEPESGGGDSAASREAGADVTGPVAGGAYGTGRRSEDDPNLVFQCHGSNVGEMGTLRAGNGNVTGGVPFLMSSGERARALTASMHKRHDEDTDTLIVAALTRSGVGTCGADDNQAQAGHLLVANTLGANSGRNQIEQNYIASALTASAGHHGHSSPRGDGQDNLVYALGSHAGAADGDQTNRSHAGGGPVGLGISEDEAYSLRAGRTQSVAFALRRDPGGIGQGHNTTFPGGVRRLTPTECERLQGFPDGWTCLCGCDPYSTKACKCPDSARYRALGNAVTVSVIQWIARRILAMQMALKVSA